MNLLTAAVASVVLLVQVTVSTSFATFHHATVARQRLSDASDVEKQRYVIQTSSSSSSLKRQFALALANGADEKDYVSPMRQRKLFLHNTDPFCFWILFVANTHPTADSLPLMHRTSTCRWRYGLCK